MLPRLPLLIGLAVVGAAADLTCRNNVNEPVDWYVVYKLPDINTHPSPLVQQGVGFMYQDVNSAGQWRLSDTSINASTGHAVAYTMAQLYKQAQSTYYIMYNDDHPGEKSTGYRGHTKGVQQFDSQSGWWLIHSVPEFPGNTSYNYPSSGMRNGQSFLCISFNTQPVLDSIAQQLYLNQPSIYAQNLPKSMSDYKLLAQVLAGKSARDPPYYRMAEFSSRGGTKFIGFAKHKKWQNDLYSELVATNLSQSIYTETWLNGPGDLDAECKLKYRTQDIHSINFVDDSKLSFTSSKDHSKWVVTQQSSPSPFVCVGDINRQKSQFNRGGGTMCFADARVWKSYESLIATTNKCDLVTDDDNASNLFGGKTWMLSIALVLLIFFVELYRNKGSISATIRSIRDTINRRNQPADNQQSDQQQSLTKNSITNNTEQLKEADEKPVV